MPIRQTEIQAIVRSVLDLTAHNAQQRGIVLNIDVASDLPPIECDAEQIVQVLLTRKEDNP